MSIRSLSVAVATLLALVVNNSISRADDELCDRCVPLSGICPDKVCVTTAKPGKQKKHCWEVECVEVCIPAVRFPWQCHGEDECDDPCLSCPPLKCGKVRCVRRLKKVDYQCDVCGYEHHIECRPTECESADCDSCIATPRIWGFTRFGSDR